MDVTMDMMAAVDSTRRAKSFRCIQNPPCCTFQACPAAKRIPRSPPHGGHPGVSFPLFAPTRHRSFHHFTPPPIPFSIAIIYKVLLFYLFTFRRAGNAKTPFPCRSRQRKGVFMPGNRPGGAASQTKSSRMGVKMSSRMPASVQTQPCSTPSSFRMVSPARTVWVTPSTVNSKAPDTT